MYLMLVPLIAYYIIFHYAPMYGATIAFRRFNPMLGIMRSPWIGMAHFQQLFGLSKFHEVFWNTVRISFIRILFGFPVPIIVALMLNELKNIGLKRVIQTAIYIPHFISWVVLGGIMVNLLSTQTGLLNQIIRFLGFQPIPFLTSDRFFVPTLVVSMIWKTFGWGTIIYLAALAGIDPQLYEAATVDGAGRLRQLFSITLPGIKSTIIVLLILRIGGIMQAGFEQIFVLYHPGVYRVADILDTYVFRLGLAEGRFELASAVGLFRSLVNFAMIIMANKLARLWGEQGVY
jgi:putative aldouronate transport system permease protein